MVRGTLESLDDDAVVVAHSWGGSPVTLGASDAPNVRHLIYLAAFMIEAGKPAPVDFRTLPPMPAFDLGPEVCGLCPGWRPPPELSPADATAVAEALSAALAERSTAEVTHALQQAGVGAHEVLTTEQVMTSEPARSLASA